MLKSIEHGNGPGVEANNHIIISDGVIITISQTCVEMKILTTTWNFIIDITFCSKFVRDKSNSVC